MAHVHEVFSRFAAQVATCNPFLELFCRRKRFLDESGLALRRAYGSRGPGTGVPTDVPMM